MKYDNLIDMLFAATQSDEPHNNLMKLVHEFANSDHGKEIKAEMYKESEEIDRTLDIQKQEQSETSIAVSLPKGFER